MRLRVVPVGGPFVAVGDEVVAPGGHLHPGQLYASNLVTIGGWLASFGISYDTAVVKDNKDAIRQKLVNLLPNVDAILTSGGAWGSERDLVVGVLDELGWHKSFHHVRMGPGKGIAFGLWEGKPVFCLPGGPPSCEMAFLQLALPAILKMQGLEGKVFPTVEARLEKSVQGQSDWTQFIHAALTGEGRELRVRPAKLRSRLQSMARKDGLIVIPEGTEELPAGAVIAVQDLR